jgi:hypothetical protein
VGRMGCSPSSPLRWLLAVAAAAVALVILTAAPAMAHGRGSDASNFESRITADPQIDGLEWSVVNGDEYLRLDNTSDREVLVLDYQGRPYLRIGPDGVLRNRNSEATYSNEDRFGQTAAPPDIDPTAEPDWEQLSDRPSYAWHDHRIHWMATADPPNVATDPDSQQVVLEWAVPFEVDGEAHEVAGELWWVPGGSALAWLLPALLVVSAPVAYGLLRTRPDVDAGRWPGLSRLAGGTLLVICLANLIHLVDDLVATPIPLSESAVSALQTVAFIAIALFGSIRAVQGEEGAFTALGVAAGATFIGQGVLYASVLSASQTASVFPGWLTRLVIAASIAQVLPMAVAAVVGTRKLLPEWDEEDLAAEQRLADVQG